MSSPPKRKNRGRQKIEIKRIEREKDRLVTFSKRTSGIEKMSNEVASLCGADVGFLVFSPTGKPYSYGHPSLESAANRVINQPVAPEAGQGGGGLHPGLGMPQLVLGNNANDELKCKHDELVAELEAAKTRGAELKGKVKAYETKGWWETPIEERSREDTPQNVENYKNFHINLTEEMMKRFSINAPSSSGVAGEGAEVGSGTLGAGTGTSGAGAGAGESSS